VSDAAAGTVTVLAAEPVSGGSGGGGGGGAAVASTPRAVADIALVNATLETPEILAGESAILAVTLENRGDADGQERVDLFANGVLHESRTVAVPAEETVTFTLSSPFESQGEFDLSVNDRLIGTLRVLAPATPTQTSDETPEPTLTTPDDARTDTAAPPTAEPDEETPAADPGSDDGFPGAYLLALLALGLAGLAAYALLGRD